MGKGKILTVVALATVSLGAGCSQKKEQVADLGYYAGNRPGPIHRLPPRPTPRLRYQSRSMQERWHSTAPAPRQTRPVPSPEAGWMPSQGLTRRWNSIVIHHSASPRSSPQSMRDYHMNVRGWDELGYDFVIGNGVAYEDGRVFVGNRWIRQMHGAHCKTPNNQYNEHGIGICLIGDFQHGYPTARQMDSLTRLVAFLTRQCGIPRSQILTHGGVTGRTECPGRNFSLASLLQRLDGVRLTSR